MTMDVFCGASLLLTLAFLPTQATVPVKWRSSFGSAITFGDPSLSQNQSLLAVILSDSDSLNTSLALISTLDGATRWRREINSAMQPQSGWVAWGDGAQDGLLFTGTSHGILCADAQSGDTVWEYLVPPTIRIPAGVPAHPTFYAGRVFLTFESGVNSSQMMVLDGATGRLAWQTTELVVTLIWPVRAVGGVGYCGWDVATNDIACTVRSVEGEVLWAKRNLTYTDPGLWDNPNLVVDAKGEQTFMFSKPGAELRCATGFDSKTGEKLWYLPAQGDVDDYDTFAWDGMYFRLMTVWGTNDTSMVVQMLDGPSGKLRWSTGFTTVDTNYIFLVGGNSIGHNGFVVVFGMTENRLSAFATTDGKPLWTYRDTVSPTTGILDRDGWLYFGDGTGTYQAIRAGNSSADAPA
eukprot:TRINITY_DN20437_c0_g1_i2.p1 TRINITY_DN20437_c0_g1~~TRINITY_DN20437_c0_g1_i2.p1  ORF type:complete len:407 (-),score=71.71 TRINITY_DN20437_c0_g1_i2:206-1426(-)